MKSLPALSIITTLAALPAFSECVAPLNDVRIPNGNKATMEEMVATNHAIQENTTEIEAYWHCLKGEQNARIEAIGPDITDDQRSNIASEYLNRHNAEAEKLQSLSDRFDAAERSFRARQAAVASNEQANQEAVAVNAAEHDAAEKARQAGLSTQSNGQGGAFAVTGAAAGDSARDAAAKARRAAAEQKASEQAGTPVVPNPR